MKSPRKPIRSALGIFLLGAVLLTSLVGCGEGKFRIQADDDVIIVYPQVEQQVLSTAVEIFTNDLKTVLNANVLRQEIPTGEGPSIVLTLNESLGWEAFSITVNAAENTLLIYGGDAHGLAYGLLEVSRLLGVSPWEWWADCTPAARKEFSLSASFTTEQCPSVKYRGIFINDEDWGMVPWAGNVMEPELGVGVIGPKTNAKIFELLLRLRANYFWPAMHSCTRPFFLTEGNREVAAKYGIYIGGSHCEPMACNANGEWKLRGKGEYDYVHNAANVQQFWEERVKDVAQQEIIYTMGMRGVHDGAMQGAKTIDEQREVLTQVLNDQREMLRQYVNEDIEAVPQVFVPYKEVLEIYNAGLYVPDDITLMWCDDNYGYVRHMPTEAERARKGGNGVYYHVSYWGRPHDYCWLATQSPALLMQQMSLCYEHGIQQMWVLNVGDLKPAEYETELFLDMAWDIQAVRRQGLEGHMQAFYSREFGPKAGKRLVPVMLEHYRLASVRRPEFLAGTRVEEADRKTWNAVHEMPWSMAYVDERLADYTRLSEQVTEISKQVGREVSNRQDAFYQLVAYPIYACEEANKKYLYAQKARHDADHAEEYWDQSETSHFTIAAHTAIYNHGLENEGKFNGIMSASPRDLTVFKIVDRDNYLPAMEDSLFTASECVLISASDSQTGNFSVHPGLGHSGKAVEVADPSTSDEGLTYTFRTKDLPNPEADSLTVEVLLIPNHPVDNESLTFSLSYDGGEPIETSYHTHGRSEEWKLNILRGQAVRRFRFALATPDAKQHTLCIKALTPGVLLDQLTVR